MAYQARYQTKRAVSPNVEEPVKEAAPVLPSADDSAKEMAKIVAKEVAREVAKAMAKEVVKNETNVKKNCSINPVKSKERSMKNHNAANQHDDSNDCMCENKLDITKICAKCAKICWLRAKKVWAEELEVNNVCAQDIMAESAEVEDLMVNDLCAQDVMSKTAELGDVALNNLCAQNVKAMHVMADDVQSNHGCFGDVTINKLCVSDLSAPNFNVCNTRRAYIGFNADFVYTLGLDIQFDAIYDDPASGISFVPTTHYTAPVSGYYAVSSFLNISSLNGSNIIVGTPVAAPSFYVNGILRKVEYVPFLSFSATQNSLLTANLLLTAGDQVTVKFDVIVLDAVLGQIPYVGTVLLKGGPVASGQVSTMDVLLLSDLCAAGTNPPQCTPCQPVVIDCSPVVVSCKPVDPDCDPVEVRGCEPCDMK